MKGFVKHLLVFSLALILGWVSALHVAEVERVYASVHETDTQSGAIPFVAGGRAGGKSYRILLCAALLLPSHGPSREVDSTRLRGV